MVPRPQRFSPCSSGLNSALCVSAPHNEQAESEGKAENKDIDSNFCCFRVLFGFISSTVFLILITMEDLCIQQDSRKVNYKACKENTENGTFYNHMLVFAP